MTFAEFCEAVSDTPLKEYQKHICDIMEEKYRKDGNINAQIIMRGRPRILTCAQLTLLFSFYLKCEEKE